MTNQSSFGARAGRGTIFAGALALLALGAGGAGAQSLPLYPLPDDDDREFWWYYQVQEEAPLKALQDIVGAPGVKMENPPTEPVKIVVIYPSLDVSDAWLRAYLAMEARLNEIGIPFDALQLASDIGDHQIQTTYTDQVMNEDYDYVIFGPTELQIQAENMKALVDAGKKVIVLTYDAVLKSFGDNQPMMYTAFSHFAGSQIMCDWVVNTLGTEGIYAMNRGVPGIVDDQRSGGFANCLADKSNWQLAYEHYGNYQREGGTTGTPADHFRLPRGDPDPQRQHRDGDGALSAVQAMEAQDKVMVTGWGGTGEELEALLLGELRATPMRMSDDLGVSMAEAIRFDLEGPRGRAAAGVHRPHHHRDR